MAATKLDGAGAAKMGVLNESLNHLQKMHGIVEQWALAVSKNQNTAVFGMQLRRAATPMVGLLKPVYGMIADQTSAMILLATRSGGDKTRIRSLREQVAVLRQAIETMQKKVKAEHSVDIELAAE